MTLLALATTFLAGIVLGDRLGPPVSVLALFSLACVLLWALLVTARRSRLPAALLAAVLVGAVRAAILSGEDPSSLVAHHSTGPVALQGVVTADAEPAGRAIRFRLAVDRIRPGERWEEVSGEVLVTAAASSELVLKRERPYVRYGDRLMLEGVLEAPSEIEEFDYPAYLARQGIGSLMSFPSVTLLEEGSGVGFRSALHSLRRNMAESLTRVVPEPQASVGQALLLGIREDLPQELVEKFRVTGTSHILAISGLHVSILLGMALAVSQGVFGRRRQYYLLAPFVLVWSYALIAGMTPSVARAAIMASVYLAALALGRPRSVLPALGLAAALMVALNPNALWSVSFQLSFAAMAGIAVIAEPIGLWINSLFVGKEEAVTERGTLASYGVDAAAITLAAIVATLPLVAFYFERLSLVGLPATLLSMPVLPLVLVTQAVAGGLGLAASFMGVPVGWLAWLATSYLTGVVDVFARLPGASFDTGRVAPLLVWAYYGALVLWSGRRSLRPLAVRSVDLIPVSWASTRWTEKAVPWWALLTVASVAALVWTAALSLPDGRLHVTFADVGQGDAVLITTPSGQNILVDGGPDALAASRLIGKKVPFWDRSIELVALTHAHSDHVAGLTEALGRYEVKHIIEREVQYDTAAYQAWRRAVAEEGATVTQARPGQVLVFSDGVYVQVLGPPQELMRGTASDVDNASVVLRVVYGQVTFLLTGDIFAEAEAVLVDGVPIDSDVLKAAHHGSRSSSSDDFLGRVSPVAAVISVGEENRFGHPHQEAVSALLEHVDPDLLFVTKDDGAVEFITDGTRLEVRTER